MKQFVNLNQKTIAVVLMNHLQMIYPYMENVVHRIYVSNNNKNKNLIHGIFNKKSKLNSK